MVPAFIGGIGWPELAIILVIVLLIFGPKKLPEIGRGIGSAIKELRKSTERKDEETEKEQTQAQATATEVKAEEPKAANEEVVEPKQAQVES